MSSTAVANDVAVKRGANDLRFDSRESEGRYRQLANLLPVAVYTCDTTGLITYYNPKAAELWGREPQPGDTDERFCGSEQMVLDSGEVLPHDQCPMAVALRDGTSFRQQAVNVRRPDGSTISVRVNIDPLRDADGRIVGAVNVFSDVTELKRAEQDLRDSQAWLAGQREALEAAVNGAPLEASLGVLVRTAIAAIGQDARAGFYLSNDEGTALHHVVGMPADYAEAIEGFKVGPDSLACGLATATGQAILTADVQQDPLWQPWLWMAEKFGYRACWSFPIQSPGGKFYGTLAIYSPRPREATHRDQEIGSLLTRTASIIISRHKESAARNRAEQDLRENEQRLRLALEAGRMGNWEWDIASNTVAWSPGLEKLHGLEVGTFPGTFDAFQRDIHPDDRQRVLEAVTRTLQESGGAPHRVPHPVAGWLAPLGRRAGQAIPRRAGSSAADDRRLCRRDAAQGR